MKNLLIIGASGFGRDIYDMAKESIGYGTEFCIKGFLDFNIDALKDYPFYPQVISSEDEYEIQTDDVFVCALGDLNLKKKVTEKMLIRGAKFFSLISKNAIISPNAQIGKGCIIDHSVRIASGVNIGDYVLIQGMASLGHDVKVGRFTRIDPKVSCVGGVEIGNEVALHTMCVINHKVIVEDNAVVGALSFVIRKVKQGTTVFGSPAKII